MTNTNLIQVEQVRERIAKMRSLRMEISPAMEKIIVKEVEIAFNEGKRTALDAVEKTMESVLEDYFPIVPRLTNGRPAAMRYMHMTQARLEDVLSIINTIKG